jgi:hypothetical protein
MYSSATDPRIVCTTSVQLSTFTEVQVVYSNTEYMYKSARQNDALEQAARCSE